MSLAEKFTFDLDFDEERTRLAEELRVQHVEKERARQEQALENSKLRHTPEELEEIKRQAREEGKQQGIIEVNETIGDLIKAILQQSQALTDDEKIREKTMQRTAVETAFGLLKKVAPALVQGKELDNINAVIEEAFQANPDEQRLVIRVHETMLDAVINTIDNVASTNGFSGKPIVLSDQNLAAGDCRIEWADGGLERMTGTLWQDLEKAIERVLTGLPKIENAPKQEEKTVEAQEEMKVEDAQASQEINSDNDTEKKEEVTHE